MKETVKNLVKNGLRLGVELWIAGKVKDAIDCAANKVWPCKKRISCNDNKCD